ncbi:MAG: nicotinate-nucleotide adenylyltransferase [Pseudomonadota bacterium]
MGLTHLVAPAGRIGIFGGAFDPPHRAHVALARAAVEELRLDHLHVLPTGHAWHKAHVLTPAADRLAMVHIAFDGIAGATVDERELHRPGPTYTADTLEELRRQYPGAELYLLLGADQAEALTSWHRWEEVLRFAIISIAGRPGAASDEAAFRLQTRFGARVQMLHLPDIPVSATDIRARVAAGQGIDHLVPAGVARYIDLHHLYKTS